MNEIQQMKNLMETVYSPVSEEGLDDQFLDSKLQKQFVEIITAAKAYYESDEYDEDEVLENIDELYKGALGQVYGSEFY